MSTLITLYYQKLGHHIEAFQVSYKMYTVVKHRLIMRVQSQKITYERVL